jgi:hypothetical protein
MYVGVLALLLLWRQDVATVNLSLRHINLYTILFVLFFGIGYGAYYATADMPIPMLAWIATLVAMHGYKLTGARMKEIQAINAVRRDAISKGMSVDKALARWTTIDQVPDEFKES